MDNDRGSIRADFHTHSTASDGTLAPAELIEESARQGLLHVALTDHDTTGGVTEAVEAGKGHGINVIAGIEFSAEVERGELHILGYGIDPEHAGLQERIERLRQLRVSRAERILDRLRELGIDLDPSTIQTEHADDSVGRPHIARALMAAGVVQSVSEGFDRFLGRGKPAFVDKQLVEPSEAIQLIHSAGGLAVVAHPLSLPNPLEVLARLVQHGLDGMECYYGEYDDAQRGALAAMAADLELIPTGGSDYHGPAFREGRDLGAVDIPEDVVRRLLGALGIQTD